MNIKTWVLAAILICGTSVFTSCSSDNIDIPATAQEYTGVPLVILDTDIGSSTDDLFALEILHHYQRQGRCKLPGSLPPLSVVTWYTLPPRPPVAKRPYPSAPGNANCRGRNDHTWPL